MIYQIAPQLCMAFKGTTPTEFFDRYDGIGGLQRALFDVIVAEEMNEQIKEAHAPSSTGTGGLRRLNKDNAKSVIARRDARRRERARAAQKDNI